MAFSEKLRKLAIVVGLYGKDADPGYDYGGGHDGGYHGGGYGGEYEDGGYSGYDEGYGESYDEGYAQPDPHYGSGYQQAPPEDEARYQSGFGATGAYSRTGARPKSPPPAPMPQRPQQAAPQQGRARGGAPRGGQGRPSNVIPMREREDRGQQSQEAWAQAPRASHPQTTVFCARRLEDSEKIIDYLVGGMTVVLNLETLDDVLFRRVLDMVSGAAFAINASVFPTSHRVYLIASAGSVYVDEQRDNDPRDPREPMDGYRSRW